MDILVLTAHRPEEVVEPARAMESDVETVVLDTTTGPLRRCIETLWRTRKAIRDHQPDVVLLDVFEMMGFTAALLFLWYRVPFVCRLVGDTWREYEEEGPRRALRNGSYLQRVQYSSSLRLNEFIYAKAAGFVVVSEQLKDTVVRRTGCSPDRIRTVPVPATERIRRAGSADSARRRLDIDEEMVVLTVTNLNYYGKYEGMKTSLRAMRELLQENDSVAYVIAGGGAYHADLLEDIDGLVGNSDIGQRIYAPGYMGDINDLYALADVFVYLSDIDGYPNVVLEAQAAGVPVVANDAYGMVEQITDGETGFLVERTDMEELKEGVRRLVSDCSVRDQLGRNARRRVLEANSPEVIGRQLQSALRDFSSISSEVAPVDNHESCK